MLRWGALKPATRRESICDVLHDKEYVIPLEKNNIPITLSSLAKRLKVIDFNAFVYWMH
jgi:hypothetical protein